MAPKLAVVFNANRNIKVKNFTPFPVLKTDRLTLRQLMNQADRDIYALRLADNVNQYLKRNRIIELLEKLNFKKHPIDAPNLR